MNRSGCSSSERLEIGVTSSRCGWVAIGCLDSSLAAKTSLVETLLLVWCKIWEELRFLWRLYTNGPLEWMKNLSCHWFGNWLLYCCSTLDLGHSYINVTSHMRGSPYSMQKARAKNVPVVSVTYKRWLQTVSTQLRVTGLEAGKTTHCIII